MPTPLPLDERLERAGQLVVRARIFYDLWFTFEDAKTHSATVDVTERFGAFFAFDAHAHFVAFVVHIAALFERRYGTINLQGLAKEAKEANLIPAQAAEIDVCLAIMMITFLCPNMGVSVESWFADTEDTDEIYERVTCLACRQLHMLNLRTGKILGVRQSPIGGSDA